jgi:hypothetical protein
MKFAVRKRFILDPAEPSSHDCVTTQMTLDARGTGVTLTGSARAGPPIDARDFMSGFFIAVAMQ